jgi:hypothetical protein
LTGVHEPTVRFHPARLSVLGSWHHAVRWQTVNSKGRRNRRFFQRCSQNVLFINFQQQSGILQAQYGLRWESAADLFALCALPHNFATPSATCETEEMAAENVPSNGRVTQIQVAEPSALPIQITPSLFSSAPVLYLYAPFIHGMFTHG